MTQVLFNTPINGIININKQKGMTSHDVVYRIRRLSGIKKVGHTGTLDPNAQGVLPICIGKATKLSDMLTGSDKRYTALLRLGVVTDTQDTTGTVIKETEPCVTDKQLLHAINSFIGEVFQLPPMYSAIKMNGKKLYQLARKGIEVEREKRKIVIYKISILERNKFEVLLDIKCSKGTYIRTLCHDIGKLLGCGACMAELTRTQTGAFHIEDAVTISQIEESGIEKFIIPVDEMFDYEKITLSQVQQQKVLNGQDVEYEAAEDNYYRVYGSDGRFLCISKNSKGILIPIKRFY
ncbi:MAG: tRNA pseudouridine(55) synthase TruB [Clostridiaceae bacterium]|nr:tRNA pseudouridine(55) synthase TruB [Clostridiaceae bacterium]